MNKLHMRSFWIGAHGSLALANLASASVFASPIALIGVVVCGAMVYMNWRLLKAGL